MARIPTGISPDVQSILQDIAIAEAQKRLTLGQQMAAREQALRQARQLRGADVLRAMARDIEMAESRDVALRQIAMQRALMEEQKRAQLLSGLAGAAGAGLVAASGIPDDATADEVAQPGDADFVGPLPPSAVASTAQPSVAPNALQLAQDQAEMNRINQEPDPIKRQELMREFTKRQRARQMAAAGGLS